MAKMKDERPEVSPHEIRIIDNLRARNQALRKAASSAVLDTTTPQEVRAILQQALDYDMEMAR